MSNTIKPIIFDLNDVRKKAENGVKFACYILGRSYDSEENGAEQSFEKAMYWYGKGKELGDPRSAYGVGTEKNLKLSEYYLKIAVDAGLPRAKTKYEQYKSEYENELGR